MRVAFRLTVTILFACVTICRAAATPPWAEGASLAFDAQGNMYVVGRVASDSIPVTPGAFQTTFHNDKCPSAGAHGGLPFPFQASCNHLFAVKLSPDGSVIWGTYLQGSGDDSAAGVVLDSAGRLFIFGSASQDFPTTTTVAGLPHSDAGSFIAELSADGSRLLFSALFGSDPITEIALDGVGNVYAVGTTDGTKFPTTPGAYLHARPEAGTDGYVFKLNPANGTLVFSTLFGGSDLDFLTNIALDSAGNIYLAGSTGSPDFPLTAGSFQQRGRVESVFVAKLDPTGSSLLFSATFGDGDNAVSTSVAVDSSGDVYVSGWGSSPGLPFNSNAFETKPSPSFLGKFDGETGARIYLTYLGEGFGHGGKVAPADDGAVWVTGPFYESALPARPVMTGDALAPCDPGTYAPHIFAKHISSDGTRQLYGTFLDAMLSVDGSGIARVTDTVMPYRTVDLTATQPPHITCVANAADGVSATAPNAHIAPGEVITIFGPGIGPERAQSYSLTESGLVSTNLDGLQVVIGGLAAPILYVSKNQINAVVPFAAPPTGNVKVEVLHPGVAVSPLSVPVGLASPGIFTLDGDGAPPGLIFNEDGGLNSADNPAKAGSVITVYVTGLGQLTPAPVDGYIPVSPAATPSLEIRILGITSPDPPTVVDASDVPQLIEGIQQIKVKLPLGAPFPLPVISIRVGDSSSPALPIYFQ